MKEAIIKILESKINTNNQEGWKVIDAQESSLNSLVNELLEAINFIPCCVNKDLDKHPIEGVNEFMLTDQEIEDTEEVTISKSEYEALKRDSDNLRQVDFSM